MRYLMLAFILAFLAACTKSPDVPLASAPSAKHRASAKNTTIAKGQTYSEADYKVPGKVVLLDFYADW